MKVAFLGLGIMGKSMARNLVKAGHELTVWNRTPKSVEGARAAKTPAEAAHDESAGLRGRVTPGTPDSACFIRRDQAGPSRPMPTVRTHSEGRSP